MAPVVSFHDELVSSRDQRESVRVVEGLRDVLAEGVAGTARGNAPATPVVRVGPEEVTHWTLVRDLLESVQGADVIQSVDTWAEAAMETEDLAVHQCRQGEIIEQILSRNIALLLRISHLTLRLCTLHDVQAEVQGSKKI